MHPFILASIASSTIALVAFARLALQRNRSADRRRATCISAMWVSLLLLAGVLVPEAWRPDVPSLAFFPQPVARIAHPVYAAIYPIPAAPKDTSWQPIAAAAPKPQPAPGVGAGVVVAAGAILVGTWWLLGLFGAFRFLRRSSAAPERVRRMTRCQVRIVPGLGVPACVGGFRPTVLLPESLLAKDDWELQAIIRHEEAHIAAGDHAWLALAYALCALQWFNPLSWLLLKRFKFESELAADDAVLLSGCRPSGYAGLLAHFESQPVPATSAMLAPMLTGRGGLAKRLHAILSTTNRRTIMNHRQRIRTILFATLGGVGLAALVAARPAGGYLRWDASKLPDVASIRALTPNVDARRIELVQVGMKDDLKGAVEWDGAGNPVPANQAIIHPWRPNETENGAVARYRHIVFRVEAQPGDTDPESCVGSPQQMRSDEPMGVATGFASSDFLMTRNGWHYFVDHLSLEPIGVMRMVSDGKGGSHVVEESKPTTKDFGWKHFGLTNIGVSVTLDAPHEIGSVFKDLSTGKVSMKPGVKFPKGFTKPAAWKQWTEVSFEIPVTSCGFVSYHPITTDGTELPESWIEGSFTSRFSADDKRIRLMYLVGLPMDRIKDLKAFFRPTISGDLTDIPLSPKEEIKP